MKKDRVVVRRCVQKSAPLSLCTRLSFTEHSHQTRGSGNSLRPLCPSSRPGMLSFTNRAPLVWNSLPASIKQAQTMNFFKSEGNQSCFTPFRPLTTSGSVCFSNRAPLIWNSLPQPIRTCTSYTSFKSHFLDFILKSRSILALALYDTNI